jgi:CPA2 family monovalent cation:H+ antiporter-2
MLVIPANSLPFCLTLASEGQSPIALNLLTIFGTAAIVATTFRRLRLEAIPGYLVAGMLVGPHAFGVIDSAANVEQIAGLAIVLLMFGIGLELDVANIRKGMAPILLVGAVSTLLFILFCWAVLMLVGLSMQVALVVAMTLSISSTAVLVRMLQQRRELRRIHGRIGLGVSIVQDLSAILMLASLPAIAAWAGVSVKGIGHTGGMPGLSQIGLAALQGIGGIAAMLVFGRYALPWILKQVAKSADGPTNELVLIASAAIALGSAILTAALGFSPEMGAFLGGFLLTFTPFRYQLGGQLAPMRDILMAVFFTAVGLTVSPRIMMDNWWIVLLGTAGVIGFKWLSIAFSAWTLGTTATVSVLTGAYLATAGEFSLVLLGAASDAGIVNASVSAVVIAIVVLSLILVPTLIAPAHELAMRATSIHIAPWMHAPKLCEEDEAVAHAPGAEGAEPAPPVGHVIIAGFGPVGRAISEKFRRSGTPFTVIELNSETVEKQSRMGRSFVYGDVTNPEVLESAGVRHAEAVILTVPDEEATLRACRIIRAMAPEIFIATRTNFLSRAIMAQELGADHVVVEEIATAEAMQREVISKIEARRKKKQHAAPPSPAV